MADLACWKDDRLVDSAALYGAFSHLMSKYPRAFDALGLAMLYCIVHKAPAGWSQPSGGPDLRKDCDQTDCRRCALQLGGYSFRWCHSLWEDGYQCSGNSASLDLRGKCPGTPSGGYMLLHLCIQRDQDLPDPFPRQFPFDLPEGLEDYVPIPAAALFPSSDEEDSDDSVEESYRLFRRLQLQRGLEP